MQHVAILKKSWGMLPKILHGEKTIESRWYSAKLPPWDHIAVGEMVYFKNSGEPVSLKATVAKVVQFQDLTPQKIDAILEEYGSPIGIEDKESFSQLVNKKKFCILVFLSDALKIEPFEIDKKGFGLMAAWLCVPDIQKIKRIRKAL
ncbi:ASCH domain-containing protein [Candidatus Woesearchaeota archaeon]|nr:ASCH domain-containing protein [Candidatus Woesearchaeota archaeon]